MQAKNKIIGGLTFLKNSKYIAIRRSKQFECGDILLIFRSDSMDQGAKKDS